jgi:acetolactate synthase-1/2/3 large subunit
MKDATIERAQPSRRGLVKSLPLSAFAAAMVGGGAKAQSEPAITSIRVPKELPTSLAETPRTASFEGAGITGAEVFAGLCKAENLSAMFCAAGNYAVINAIAAAGVPSYGGRSEGSMAAAADGFSRVTGEVVACSGTEGPGFTHMVQSIYTAHAAHTPLLVLASNMTVAQDDSQSFIQSVSQQEISSGIRKYGKRLTAPNRVYEYGGYAFRALKSGVPGPVHLDFPGEVARQTFNSPDELQAHYDKAKYRSESRAAPPPADVRKAVEMIGKAERPLIIAGHGVFYRKAWEPLLAAAERNDIVVVGSGPVRGHFPDDHRLSASLSPDALTSADLVIFIGQYLMPTPLDYRLNPEATTIRVHPEQEDIGRNWPVDLGVVGDELAFLQAWVSVVAAARAKMLKTLDEWCAQGVKYSETNQRLHPVVMGRELHDFFYAGKIDPKQTINTWGGFTCLRFVPPYLRANRPGQGVVSLYQSGTIGAELNHGLGAAAAVKQGASVQAAYKGAPVLATCSDGGMAYGLLELDTAVKYRLPLIVVVYNNDSWGVWPQAEGIPRAMHMYLFQENLRYDQMAQALGCHGEYVRTAAELRAALARSYDIAARESLPSLINVQGLKEYTSGKLFPPGATIPPAPGIAAISH